MRQPHGGLDVQFEVPGLLRDAVLLEGPQQAHSGVVDEDVHRTRRIREPGDDGRDPGVVREIGGEYLCAHAVLILQFLRLGLQPDSVSGHEDHIVALLGELAGEFGTDPGGCSGN